MQKPWKGNWSRKYFWISNDRLVFEMDFCKYFPIIYKLFLELNTNHELMICISCILLVTKIILLNPLTGTRGQSNSKKLVLIVRSELILILNSTWTNQITHCRELVNLFSAKRKLNWRPKKGDSSKIYIKQKNPLLLGPHCGQSVSEAPFEFFLQICRFKKLLIPLCTLLAFVMETFHSRIWRPETLYFMLFSYRVIMYRPHWKQFHNFFSFKFLQRQLNYFSFLFITLTMYLLRIQLSDTLRTLYIRILTLKRDPGNLQ